MAARQKPTSEVETAVLTRSRRRCCICFGLHRDVEVKAGQIAHLDGNSANRSLDNLAFLCLQHHDQYDSSTSQSKSLTVAEVKAYRKELYAGVVPVIESRSAHVVHPPAAVPSHAGGTFDSSQGKELRGIVLEVLADMAGPLWSLRHLAYRLSIPRATVERLLFDLAEEGIVRIDRRRGTTKKIYSLTAAPENRLIDTFVSQLHPSPVSDDRFVRRNQHELDGVIRTDTGRVYAVETMCSRVRMSRADVAARIQHLVTAKRELGVPDAVGVLLIGITKRTRGGKENLKDLEAPDLMIRFVELH